MKISLMKKVLLTTCLLPIGLFASASQQNIKLLFSLKADKAELHALANNQYELSIYRHTINPILVFTDRPVRLAYRMPYSQFNAMVNHGPNSFLNDQPNMVLNWGNKGNLHAYEVLSHTQTKKLDKYVVKPLLNKQDSSIYPVKGTVSMFIDDSSSCSTNVTDELKDMDSDQCVDDDTNAKYQDCSKAVGALINNVMTQCQ